MFIVSQFIRKYIISSKSSAIKAKVTDRFSLMISFPLKLNLTLNNSQVKLMNGEKAAFQTPTFALKRQRTLDTLIRDIYAEHCSDHKVVSFTTRRI